MAADAEGVRGVAIIARSSRPRRMECRAHASALPNIGRVSRPLAHQRMLSRRLAAEIPEGIHAVNCSRKCSALMIRDLALASPNHSGTDFWTFNQNGFHKKTVYYIASVINHFISSLLVASDRRERTDCPCYMPHCLVINISAHAKKKIMGKACETHFVGSPIFEWSFRPTKTVKFSGISSPLSRAVLNAWDSNSTSFSSHHPIHALILLVAAHHKRETTKPTTETIELTASCSTLLESTAASKAPLITFINPKSTQRRVPSFSLSVISDLYRSNTDYLAETRRKQTRCFIVPLLLKALQCAQL